MIKEKNNVVIIGGGIVGSLLALILGQNGLKVTVIDRLSKDKLYSISSNLSCNLIFPFPFAEKSFFLYENLIL